MSGAGKSTALAELGRRGFRVVDTDEPGWTEVRDGEPLWREDRISKLLAADEPPTVYVSGCVANQGLFYDRFDTVVLLSVPAELLLERIATRTTNDFGKASREREQILADLAAVEPLLRETCTHELDTTAPLEQVVAARAAIGDDPRYSRSGEYLPTF